MDYGISTAAFASLPLEQALSRIARFTNLAELRCESRHDLMQPANLRAALAARRNGLRFTFHGPYSQQIIWSSEPALRRRALDDHRRYIELAAQIEASVYVVHPDYTRQGQPYDAQLVAQLQASFAELAGLQRELGLRIAVENMPGVGRSHFSAPGIDTGGLPVAVDVGHGHLSGSLPELLAQPHIVHWHLHDNPGLDDDPHLAVGSGTIVWPPIVARIAETVAGDQATAVVEVSNEDAVIASLAFLADVEMRLRAGDG